MHIRNGKHLPHLFHHCVVASKLWFMIFCLFGVTVNELVRDILEFIKKVNGRIWKVVQSC